MNVVVVHGVLSSAPRSKTLPSGSILTNWEITTTTQLGKLTVPVIWFDAPKSTSDFGVGDSVVVLGSVRRRFYVATGRTLSSTEVLADRACKASRTASVAKLLEQADERLRLPA